MGWGLREAGQELDGFKILDVNRYDLTAIYNVRDSKIVAEFGETLKDTQAIGGSRLAWELRQAEQGLDVRDTMRSMRAEHGTFNRAIEK
jgi:hypothetical protein